MPARLRPAPAQAAPCLGLIEVNTPATLDCPICFADWATSQTGTTDAGAGRS